MALSKETLEKRKQEKMKAYTKECFLLAIQFLEKYKIPITDKRLLLLQN
jgi:hypothetical protein